MEQNTTNAPALATRPRDILTEILRNGAQRMLAAAVEDEVAAYIEVHRDQCDAQGHRLVVRNGYLPTRSLQTAIGPVEVTQPRVNNKRVGPDGRRMRFSSSILPPYLRRTKSLDDLIPWLYLKGISTGDFPEALQALLGPDAPGLSATNICRLKRTWEGEWKDWSTRRSLVDKQYVYVWADGIHFTIRLEDEGNDKQCILVLMGATATARRN